MKLGLFEKTIRTWRQDLYTNHGYFTESRQGKHARLIILDDEGLRHKAAEWVRTNATAKGKPNMTGEKFCAWVTFFLVLNSPTRVSTADTTTHSHQVTLVSSTVTQKEHLR